MSAPANDTRPLQPLTFLAAAIRAEVVDLVTMVRAPVPRLTERLTRIGELLAEIERHAQGNPRVTS